jgi:glycosyltransferase involved in cell wall biosynthesis
MIAVSHYGAKNDISGVTTWLGLLLVELKADDIPVSLHLEHFGEDGSCGSFFLLARELGIPVSWVPRSGDTSQDVKGVLEFLNRSKPDVFLPQCLPSAHFAARLAQRYGLPWVFTLHSDDPAYWALADLCGPEGSHGIWVAVSETIAAAARERYPKADIRVIPYGVSLPEGRAAWNPASFRIVYSGRLVEEQKRVSLVIQALIEACRGSNRIEAVVLGDGPAKPGMEEAVRFGGMEDRIRFAGRLCPQEVQAELLQAQAIVLMSDYEGLPVCLLEAMACGVVPVVRAIRSGVPEIVWNGETGLLVDDNPKKAAAVLVKLSEQSEDWGKMSQAARDLIVRCYSHEQCMKRWCGVLDELSGVSKVKYPIPVPYRPELPHCDERLKDLDQRAPGVTARMVRWSCGIAGRVSRRLKRHF